MDTIVPVIETRGLTKTYKGVQALQVLDMEVTPNSICGFLGPNGAGKHATIFYSTHILDDVQRVSDTVVILNRGKLVAQGPIEEVLALGQAVSFTLTVKGDGEGIEARLRGNYSDRRLAGDDFPSPCIHYPLPNPVAR